MANYKKIPPTKSTHIKATYDSIIDKVKDANILNQKELITLLSMKKNARDVNKRKIVKEVRLMPTKEQVKEVVKQVEKKKTPAEIEKEEYSNKAIDHIMEVLQVSRFIPENPRQIFEQGKKYFLICEEHTVMPTSSGLAMALGMSRKQLLAIASGELRVQYQDTYQQLWQMLEVYDETMMKQGKVNAIVGIFNQKNNHGWVDKVEVIHGQDRIENDDEIAKRYEDIIEVETKDSD